MCIMRDIIEMEHFSTVYRARYNWNGAVGVLCIVRDIIKMKQLGYCA